jgi:hypothetical protein
MKERPIIFSGEMVLAILAGQKTQTRRVINLQPILATGVWGGQYLRGTRDSDQSSPYGRPGDCLWVKETFVIENTREYHGEHHVPADGRPIQKHEHDAGADGPYWLIPHYRATEPEPHIVPFDFPDSALEIDYNDDRTRWAPSIFMPRWASRITLEVMGVRVERVQDISEEDAIREGITGPHMVGYPAYCFPGDSKPRYSRASAAFEVLWDSLNAKRGFDFIWSTNPWVWVIEFAKV